MRWAVVRARGGRRCAFPPYGSAGPRGSARLDQLLQAAQPVRARLVRVDLRPGRPRDLADIDVAARIDGDAVRGDELAEFDPGMERAEPGEDLALVADDAEARPEIGHVAVDRLVGAELADIAQRLLAARHVEPARTVQVVPLRLVSSVAVEDLDAVVLAAGDIEPAVRIAADIVDDVELAGIRVGLAP